MKNLILFFGLISISSLYAQSDYDQHAYTEDSAEAIKKENGLSKDIPMAYHIPPDRVKLFEYNRNIIFSKIKDDDRFLNDKERMTYANMQALNMILKRSPKNDFDTRKKHNYSKEEKRSFPDFKDH